MSCVDTISLQAQWLLHEIQYYTWASCKPTSHSLYMKFLNLDTYSTQSTNLIPGLRVLKC
jgi:hypothetical protein